MNPHEFRSDDKEKIEQIRQSIQKYQIDTILLSSLDYKWISTTKDKME